jgi:ABC-type nitrate/sulfonate/bicarbonate transport system substrate-binding protein
MHKLKYLLVGFAAATLVAAGSASAQVTKAGRSTAAQAGPRIPSDTVRFAYYPCCADSSLPVVGVRKGFFKDVGISITPANGFQWSQSSQFVPAMQRGDFDIATGFSTAWLTTLSSFGMNLPPVMNYDVYLGRVILLAPKSPLKTTSDYMKSGLKFRQAAAKAVAAIKGHTIYTDPFAGAQPPYYDILLSYGKISSKDIKFQYLADDKILALSATPGQIELAFPLSAPVLVAMIRGGWRPLIDMGSILDYDGSSSQATELMKETGNQCVAVQRSFLEKHHDTVLRFVSVMYRSIAYLSNPKTKAAGDKILADTINAAQGLKLVPADIDTIYKTVDPLFGWADQANKVWNPKSPFYAPKGYESALQSLIDNKSLPAGNYDLQKFLASKSIYRQMVGQQHKAQKLFKKAAKSKHANKKLVEAAKKYYGWYDFLDAVRYLEAALK